MGNAAADMATVLTEATIGLFSRTPQSGPSPPKKEVEVSLSCCSDCGGGESPSSDQAFLEAQGTVADRHALARLEAADVRLERDIVKAQLNRVKTKLKVIETEIMTQATRAKMMQAEMRL
mgnify:CR=1 FL=1